MADSDRHSDPNTDPDNQQLNQDQNQLKERQYEIEHVHQVYDQIATHFSETRYKPWPVVDDFLKTLPPGSIGLDIGCGNGKYLSVNPNVFIVASDRSLPLVQIATSSPNHKPHEAHVADMLDLPHPESRFDFVISIAAIHHLSSPSRRVEVLKRILATLKPTTRNQKGGEALIFVWALEQKDSRRGWDRGDDQDVLVPWVLKQNYQKQNRKTKKVDHEEELSTKENAEVVERKPSTFHRYYHLYKQGEIEEDAKSAGGNVVRSGYDRDNWWVVIERREQYP